jgi:hypothetical protein
MIKKGVGVTNFAKVNSSSLKSDRSIRDSELENALENVTSSLGPVKQKSVITEEDIEALTEPSSSREQRQELQRLRQQNHELSSQIEHLQHQS